MNYISFPGLGINEFPLNKTAFTVFGRDIVWYGVIITFGIILALLYVCYRAKKDEGIKTDDVFDYAIYLVFFGVIGARLYYVIMEFDSYKGKTFVQTLMNAIAIWEGGLAIYGGIIAGAIALICVSLYKKIKVMKAFDMIAPAVMLGQLIGRWGNFCNAEAHGGETTLPWRMGIRAPEEATATYYHPTFLYESLWNLIGFILINIFYRKKRYDGQIFVMYITWYGFGRMLIEGLRTDSLYVGNFRISQVIAFLCFFFGAAILTAMEIVHQLRRRDERRALAAEGIDAAELEPVAESEVTEEAAETETAEAEITDEASGEADEAEAKTSDEAEEVDELIELDSLTELEEAENVSELEILDGAVETEDEALTETEASAENGIEATEIDSEEETDDGEMFEISDNYTEDGEDEE